MKQHNFDEIIEEVRALHWQKNKDYGQSHDPYANIRGSTEWGIPAWKGAMVRLNDKVKRLQKFAKEGELANESAEDSMMDIAVYALIALDLFRQEHGQASPVTLESALTSFKKYSDPDPGDQSNHPDEVERRRWQRENRSAHL